LALANEAEETALATQPEASPASARPKARAYHQARRHSRQVRWLRRVILAGAVLAIGAILAVSVLDPFGRIPANVTLGPVSVAGTKVVMESPKLTGFRQNNRGYEVTAASAMQDVRKPSIVELRAMKGRLVLDEAGRIAQMEAASGVFETQKEHLDLADDIRFWTNDGQEARLKSASVDFKAGTAVSRDAVAVTFSDSTIEADGIEISDNGKVVSFIGRVHALVQPGPGRDRSRSLREEEPIALRKDRPALAASAEPTR
jgi:lipopolysaccharide export system protein LptC